MAIGANNTAKLTKAKIRKKKGRKAPIVSWFFAPFAEAVCRLFQNDLSDQARVLRIRLIAYGL
jgi:hypothetical protein